MQVSVIIPCFNVEQYIKGTLQAVMDQEGVDIEVICVDDGSDDGTVADIQEFMKLHPDRITLIQQRNSGACSARNVGMNSASAAYIQFLDADDRLEPGKLSHQVALAQASDLDLLVGDYVAVYENGREEVIRSEGPNNWLALIKTKLGTTSANLWKRDAVIEAGGWAEDLASSQDYELAFRMLQAGALVGYDNSPMVRVLKRSEGSISQSFKRENWLRYIDLRQRIKDHLANLNEQEFTTEIAVCDQYIFMALRALSQFDMQKAVQLSRTVIPKGFKPVVSKAITRRYIKLYSIFGFSFTEQLIRLLKPGLYRRS